MKTIIQITPLTLALASGTFLQAATTIQFSATTYTVVEDAGAVALTVKRLSDTDTVVSVDYATADGTATNGVKYTAVAGTLGFGAGQTNQTIAVPILNDGFADSTKTFRVILSNSTNAVLGARTTATVSISDNDVGINFQFADGHMETKKWLDPRTTPARLTPSGSGYPPEVPSPNNSDLRWLQERCTSGSR